MLSLALTVLAAADNAPHYHRGKLAPYQLGPPSVTLSTSDEQRLRAGRPVMQTVLGGDGESRRLIMVQDVPVPSSVVLGRIMDLDKYDQMVSGVDSCVTYASAEDEAAGVQTVKSTYEIQALHLKLKYFIEHTYAPAQNCMTFRLDYDRRSDLDDTVGYWYVDPTHRNQCRVYYSCECKLRGWVPGPVYNMLTKEALKKATVWVERESIKEWRESRAAQPDLSQLGVVKFVSAARESLQEAGQNMGEALRALDLPPMPQLPLLQSRKASKWIDGRRRAAVRFVSNRAAPQPPAAPLES